MSGPTVSLRLPQMVFLGGYLLPHGAFQLAPSPIDPSLCDLGVVRDFPALPAALAEALRAIPTDAAELPAELQGARAFMTAPGGDGMPVLVEVGVRNLKLYDMTKPAG